MQGNQKVEKFKKVPRVLIEGTEQDATITRGKKYNKPRRHSNFKDQFLKVIPSHNSDLWG